MFITSLVDLAALPTDGKPQVALVGRSNVGKSSLVNHLAGRKHLARESSQPGRTQTLNLYKLDPNYYLVDMPGYGFARTSKERQVAFSNLIVRYLETTSELALVLLVIDAYVGPTDLDQDMLSLLVNTKLPFIMIVNKVDKLSQSELAKLKTRLATDYDGLTYLFHSMDDSRQRGLILDAIHTALADK